MWVPGFAWPVLSLAFQASPQLAVQQLLNSAEQAAKPEPWATYIMRADEEAARLERGKRDGAGTVRSVQITEGLILHYRWNDLQQSENYSHDLLRKVVRELEGTRAGADALVRLLQLGPCNGDSEEFLGARTVGSPLHKRIIDLLSSGTWRKLNDPRFLQIGGEAYETWWSLCVPAWPNCGTGKIRISGNGFDPATE